jgi:hypothetical protein
MLGFFGLFSKIQRGASGIEGVLGAATQSGQEHTLTHWSPSTSETDPDAAG